MNTVSILGRKDLSDHFKLTAFLVVITLMAGFHSTRDGCSYQMLVPLMRCVRVPFQKCQLHSNVRQHQSRISLMKAVIKRRYRPVSLKTRQQRLRLGKCYSGIVR